VSTVYSQIHNGSAQASVLRGAPAFVGLALANGGDCLIGGRGWRFGKPHIPRRTMILNPVVVEYFEWCNEQDDSRTICDITFPADRPEEVFGEVPLDDELVQHDIEVTRDQWRLDGENIANLRRCAELAHAVTVPRMIWAPSFVDPKKVFELPDLDPTSYEDLHRFMTRLEEIWDS
jgi:hypothetical protein